MICVKIIILLISLTFFQINVQAQDLFNIENSVKYADYLFMAGKYTLAQDEYQRLIRLDTNNIFYWLRSVQAVRFTGNYTKALQLLRQKKSTFYRTDTLSNKEYARLLILCENGQRSRDSINSSEILNAGDKAMFMIASYILENNFKAAEECIVNYSFSKTAVFEQLLMINKQCSKIKMKKAWLAGSLSSIIPGSGKIYASYWQDGVLAFIYIGMNSWQTYRAFNKYGTDSVFGWISLVLTSGFYFGNIYGSIKAANKYNFVKLEEYKRQIEEILNNY